MPSCKGTCGQTLRGGDGTAASTPEHIRYHATRNALQPTRLVGMGRRAEGGRPEDWTYPPPEPSAPPPPPGRLPPAWPPTRWRVPATPDTAPAVLCLRGVQQFFASVWECAAAGTPTAHERHAQHQFLPVRTLEKHDNSCVLPKTMLREMFLPTSSLQQFRLCTVMLIS